MSAVPPVRRTEPADIVKADFAAFWAAADKSRLTNPTGQRSLLVAAHKYAMCFSYLARAMQQQPQEAHQRIFFQELTSDSVHLVHALVGGDARGGRFYLRSIIENFWRHHYFRDHVVEYGWLHTRSKYYHEMKQLREHCSFLNCFLGEMSSLMTSLPNLYSELSAAVHSTSARTLVLRQTLGDIRLQEDQVKNLSRDLLATLKACLALCLVSEREVYLGLHINVQEYLMKALNKSQQDVVKAAHRRAEVAA